jgi:hypothetical protein
VTTYGNTAADGSRSFSVNLGATTGGVTHDTGVATLVDDEGAVGASIGDATMTEGDTGTVNVTGIVTLSSPAPADVAITYATSGISATPGLDFKSKIGTVKIKAGKTTGKIAVTVNGDTLDEDDEQIEIQLVDTGTSGIEFADALGTVTIVDDDGVEDPEPEVNWQTMASSYPGPTGTEIPLTCPGEGVPSPIWGTGIYTDDSSICTAAVHAGYLTLDGGNVIIRILDGLSSYEGSDANGITSGSWGAWDRSFEFVPVGPPAG